MAHARQLKIAGPLSVVKGGTLAAQVQVRRPRKPAAVTEDAQLSQTWDDLVGDLEDSGLLAAADATLVELAARHLVKARAAYGEADHVAARDRQGAEKRHPATMVWRQESAELQRILQQLGATPVARLRAPAQLTAEDLDNPFLPPAARR